MFTTNHFIWIGICMVLITILLFISLKFKFNEHIAISIMAVTSLISEVCKVFTHIDPVNGDYTNGGVISVGALPLHLCSIFIFIFFYLALDNNKHQEINKKIISFFVPIGLFGGTLAIMMATSGVRFDAPYAYQCFIYHAVMVYLALYYIITKQVDLGLKSFIRNIIILFALSIIMIWINGAFQNFETNFFFVVKPPTSGLPVLNLNHGWYVYFIHLVSLGLLLELFVSLPYIIKEKKNK